MTTEPSVATRGHASLVAHELRTPLTGLLGVLEVLADPAAPIDNDERAELLDIAQGEARRMALLLENLLSEGRIHSEAIEPTLSTVPVASVIREALTMFPAVSKRTIVSPAEALAHADPALLRQILVNLLQNVDRYAPDGEVEIRIRPTGEWVQILVADDGPGVGADLETVQAGGRGLGVGLALSRKLARRMGGDLALGPPLRRGATLIITLPRGRPTQSHLESAITDPGAMTPRTRLLTHLTEALEDRSIHRSIIGISDLSRSLLGTSFASLAVSRDGTLDVVGPLAALLGPTLPKTRIRAVNGGPSDTTDTWPELAAHDVEYVHVTALGTGAEPAAYLVLGWAHGGLPSTRFIQSVAPGLARLTAVALDRSKLAADLDQERNLRDSVLEALPIAVSVFAGNPPKVVDWNSRERRMLGIDRDTQRPSDLAASQQTFDVRFWDGTPLDSGNAPVVETMNTGAGTGPFFLRVRRADGSEIITRTYCAPFFDGAGGVAGAVVTSEEVDPRDLPPPPN